MANHLTAGTILPKENLANDSFDAETRATATAFLTFHSVNTDIPLTIRGISDCQTASAVKCKLLEFYGESTSIVVKHETRTLMELERVFEDTITVMPSRLFDKKKFNFADLLHIMELLVAENGCPWDKAQTHESIRANLIEEAYEVVDAIDNCDVDNLKEELGDLLLQSVFHCVIAQKNREFDYTDMLDTLCTKLIFRHPHVFGATKANDSDGALTSWETAKAQEKSQESLYDKLRSIPLSFPQSMRALKVAKRAVKVGIGASIDAELCITLANDKLMQSMDGDTEKCIGECLYSVCNLARLLSCDPEIALKKTIDGYVNRLHIIEELLNSRGIQLLTASPADVEAAVVEVAYCESTNS